MKIDEGDRHHYPPDPDLPGHYEMAMAVAADLASVPENELKDVLFDILINRVSKDELADLYCKIER